MKQKSRPATAGGLVPLSSPGSSWRRDLRIVAKTNGRGGESTRSVEFRRKTVGSRWRHFFGPLKKKGNAGRVKLGRGFENRVGSCFR